MPDFKGRGLFVFSDPGGAKGVLAQACAMKDPGASKLISDRVYEFFNHFPLYIEKPELPPAQVLAEFKPDFVFTGTSYTSSLELEYIKAANESGIQSFAFIDHWTAIRERFSWQGTEILPGQILVLDEEARRMALGQGLEDDRVLVFGNPYHEFLKTWKPSLGKEAFLEVMGILNPRKGLVVYAPDPLSNVNGTSNFGFDEVSATRDLVPFFREWEGRYEFLCNPHPNQDLGKLKEAAGSTMSFAPPGTDVLSLIYYADLVIGFFSNILVEAKLLNKSVIRFFPEKGLPDPLDGKDIGIIAYPETISQRFKQLL
jgi:hypothetical protein